MLISDNHRSQYQQYFDQLSFDHKPNRWQDKVERLYHQTNSKSVIDYGCGIMASLSEFSDLPIINYDPGVPAYSQLPPPADLVVCLDVLEHVEPDCMEHVLNHVILLAQKALFVTISTQESTKLLPNGAPWHCFVRDKHWWREKLHSFTEEAAMGARKEYVAVLYKYGH